MESYYKVNSNLYFFYFSKTQSLCVSCNLLFFSAVWNFIFSIYQNLFNHSHSSFINNAANISYTVFMNICKDSSKTYF